MFFIDYLVIITFLVGGRGANDQ